MFNHVSVGTRDLAARHPLLRRRARRARLPPHHERGLRLRLGRRVARVLGHPRRRGRGRPRQRHPRRLHRPEPRGGRRLPRRRPRRGRQRRRRAGPARLHRRTTTPPSCATRTATSSRPCTCPTCRSRRSSSRPAGRGDDDLDPPVLRPAAGGVVAGDRLAVAHAGGLHPPGLDAVRRSGSPPPPPPAARSAPDCARSSRCCRCGRRPAPSSLRVVAQAARDEGDLVDVLGMHRGAVGVEGDRLGQRHHQLVAGVDHRGAGAAQPLLELAAAAGRATRRSPRRRCCRPRRR